MGTVGVGYVMNMFEAIAYLEKRGFITSSPSEKSIELRKLGRELAGVLGFDYPEDTDKRVTGYINMIKNSK